MTSCQGQPLRLADYRQPFTNALPPSRLGTEHASFEEFRQATYDFSPQSSQEYSLVLVTESSQQRILLGKKHRGFGHGMYNSFGGKIEPGETVVESACRELQEETGIGVSLDCLENSNIGTMYFTFQDNPVEMVVHVYRVHVALTTTNAHEDHQPASPWTVALDPSTIRGCDEITPYWFDRYYDIPLDNMFADDSIWLTAVLSCDENVTANGWFHLQAGGQETNTVLHHYLELGQRTVVLHSQPETFTLEKRLFHALHDRMVRSPTLKEFNEAYAFVNAVRRVFLKQPIDVVIDVAGGHGAVAALFLVSTSARSAVVVDPARVGNGGVHRAWASTFFPNKRLDYRYECLRTGLPAELSVALTQTSHDRVLVVACHACQHLSDEIVELSCRRGVHVAVMPCCQNDVSTGSAWKAASKNMQVPIEKTMDILLAGKAMSWSTCEMKGVSYDVRMKVIDSTITPQNRIIVCRAHHDGRTTREDNIERAHQKLRRSYRRAHNQGPVGGRANKVGGMLSVTGSLLLLAGFALGMIIGTRRR